MRALKLFGQLTVYYVALVLLVMIVMRLFPHTTLPIGGVEELLQKPGKALLEQANGTAAPHRIHTLGQSLFWLSIASLGALLTALPVSWLYMAVRTTEDYDQSLVNTVVILPIVVTSIVIIVQSSLSLAFGAGIEQR